MLQQRMQQKVRLLQQGSGTKVNNGNERRGVTQPVESILPSEQLEGVAEIPKRNRNERLHLMNVYVPVVWQSFMMQLYC